LFIGTPSASLFACDKIGDDGLPYTMTADPDRKAIVRSDNGHILGVFKNGYTVHQYQDALLRNVELLLDDDLQIGSAGLLRNGGVAYVSLEMDENVHTAAGMTFRPHLLAATSHDGTLSTTYKRVTTRVVCDNTCEAALGENGEVVKVKHSKYSTLRIANARDALGILASLKDDTIAEIERLAAWTVTPAEFSRFMDAFMPIPTEKDAPKAAVTRAENTRSTLIGLWSSDERVAPWKGTALGVQQMVNTYRQHERTARAVGAHERNMLDLLHGRTGDADRAALRVLAGVR
jgi:phage/plasmid-like protein (TIGR03299 family)